MPLPTTESDAPAFLTAAQIAKKLPENRAGKPVHVGTITRYMVKGVRLADGSRLTLRAVRFPGGWRSTWPWAEEFVAALTADRVGVDAIQAGPAPASKRVERAERYLAAAGF